MSARSLSAYTLDDEDNEATSGTMIVYVDAQDHRHSYDATTTRRESAACIAFFWSSGQFAWGLFLLAVAVFKVFDNSLLDFVSHFTNISWSLQVFFFLATSAGPVLIAWRSRVALRFVVLVIAALLMPIWGIIVAVVIIIFILIGTDADAITSALREYPPEEVIIGNDVYHVVPLISFLFFFALMWRLVFYALNLGLQRVNYVVENLDTRNTIVVYPKPIAGIAQWQREPAHARMVTRVLRYRHVSIALFLYQAYFGSLIPVLFYIAVFDPRVVYGTEMSFSIGFLLLLVSLTLSNAIPLAVAIYGSDLGSLPLTMDNYLFAPTDD